MTLLAYQWVEASLLASLQSFDWYMGAHALEVAEGIFLG